MPTESPKPRPRKLKEAPLPSRVDQIEIAKSLGRSPATIRAWVAKHEFPRPARVIGTMMFWDRERMARYLSGGSYD